MKRLLLWLIAAFVPAAIGAPFPAPDYYRRLNKPSWAPPPWIFGPVWTALYAMIGTSAWLVARRGGGGTRAALGLWWAQLALNAAWTPIFFGARNRGLALVEILVTWVVIVATTVAFFTRRTAAGLLLLPYLAWVTFASALSYAVWRDN
ncbi:MAG TPA: TspO/MBR family protein [Candidatus Limnocylindria bacterium]|jgi:tryptophan-rich sensory protein|nr:TspO/MBR family protein [Candidatus Limnocylindria bacterium]